MKRLSLLTLTAVLLSGCYHATVVTGLTPSAQTVEQNWASGWIFGLVSPSTVETMASCSSGVARVETQLGFANQLVSILTLGIYTPMQIVVTCASGQEQEQQQDLQVVQDADAFSDAVTNGQPFLVDVH